MNYLSLLGDLGIDLMAVFILAYAIYYRRHRRRDLLLAYVALNVGLFVVVAMLTTAPVELALGFGLFAILSIIRLRSDAITQEEVAYYFVTLVLGLVNGLRLEDRWMTVLLNIALLVVMFVVDNRRVLPRTQRRMVILDVIIEDPAELVADLERRVRGPIVYHMVQEVDYVRDVTVVDVRFIADAPPRRRGRANPPPAAPSGAMAGQPAGVMAQVGAP